MLAQSPTKIIYEQLTEQEFLTLAVEAPTYSELAAIADELLRQNEQLQQALDDMTARYIKLRRQLDEPL